MCFGFYRLTTFTLEGKSNRVENDGDWMRGLTLSGLLCVVGVCVVVGHVVSWGRLPRVCDPGIARVLCASTCDACVSQCVIVVIVTYCKFISLCTLCVLCASCFYLAAIFIFHKISHNIQKRNDKLCGFGRAKVDFDFMVIS